MPAAGGVAVALVAVCWLLLAGGAASAAGGSCSVPAAAHGVASVAGVRVWWQREPTPASMRRQYGATYPSYSGCAPGYQPQVLFRDYAGDSVVVRVAGDYVGLLDRGGTESLYLSDLVSGRTTSTRSFTPSVQDNGGSEANEPGPLVSWTVTSGGWLVYLDTLSDAEGYGMALVAFDQSGGTTLDLVPTSSGAPEIRNLSVNGETVSWSSSFSGKHRMKLRSSLLPTGLPTPLPNACQLVPRSLAKQVLGPLSATLPAAPLVPPAGFWPRVRTGTGHSACAYAAAGEPAQTMDISEQRVTAAVVKNQQRAIGNTPRADGTLVLPGVDGVLFDSRLVFSLTGREDLRLFIHDIEVDVRINFDTRSNSDNPARYVETVGLAIERALRDAAPAASHV